MAECTPFSSRLQDIENEVLSSSGPSAHLRVQLMMRSAMTPSEADRWSHLTPALMAVWFATTPAGQAGSFSQPLTVHVATLVAAYFPGPLTEDGV